MSAPAPQTSDAAIGATLRPGFSRGDFMLLTKARLSALVVVTTAAGYWLHCLLVDWPGALPWRLVHTIAGTALTAFGASVFNQLMEMDADARMQRTADRPLASRRLQPEVAFVIGALLAGAGIIHLGVKVNTEAAALAGLTLLVYLFVYTPMKRKSVWNTIVGAVSGAIPPVIGWVAVPGDTAGPHAPWTPTRCGDVWLDHKALARIGGALRPQPRGHQRRPARGDAGPAAPTTPRHTPKPRRDGGRHAGAAGEHNGPVLGTTPAGGPLGALGYRRRGRGTQHAVHVSIAT